MLELIDYLVPLPVVLPLLAAGLRLALGPRWLALQRGISVATLSIVLLVALALLVGAETRGPLVVQVGGWPAPIGISLVADRLSALLLLISVAITLAVLVYSIGQGMVDEEGAAPLAIYHPTYLILVAGVAQAFLAGDLFNIYVGFEVLLTASYVLLTLGGTSARLRAGATYVVVSLLSSMVFLIAVAAIYAATGTLNLAQLSGRLAELPPQLQLVLHILLLTGFAIKAAVFPLAAWLPDSYPTAPAPVTAVFAGLLTKVGVYAMVRTQTLLFPDGQLDTLLLVAALATMLVGILGAVAQTDIKRLLSFTLVSHIGFMVFGLGVGSAHGLSAAVFYVVHHITVQTSLFLVAGLIERRGGTTSMRLLGGLAGLSPLLGILFFIPAMNLAGIPPLSGFLGKLGLLQAGVAAGTPLAYILVTGSVVTSLLTLYAMARVWNYVFWRSPTVGMVATPGTVLESPGEQALTSAYGIDTTVGPASRRAVGASAATMGGQAIMTTTHLPRTMTGATLTLVALGLALTVLAGPLSAYCERTASEALDSGIYVEAVGAADGGGDEEGEP